MNGGKLSPNRVPPPLRDLAALAEEWGLGDDVLRETAVASASSADLRRLVSTVQLADEESLAAWMTGPESYSVSPSAEYLAFACLTMAFDSARSELDRRNESVD